MLKKLKKWIKDKRLSIRCYFLNPFGEQEAKIWLFNFYYYKSDDTTERSITIDILNLAIHITWWRN